MKPLGLSILRSYTEVLFLSETGLGLIVVAVTCINPNVGFGGIVAVLAAYGAARFIQMDKSFLDCGVYFYNPLLVGLSLGFVFQPSVLAVFLTAVAGILTLFLCVALSHVLRTYLSLPVMSLPFVVTSSLAYLASLQYENVPHSAAQHSTLLAADFGLPYWITGFLRSFGAVLFVPSVLGGIVFAAIVLYRSRILFLLAVLGYYAGVGMRTVLLRSADQAFGELNSFNFMLIAMAIGGVFLVPSLKSYLLAAFGVIVSTVILDAILLLWADHTLPPYALPYNVVVLGTVYVLGLTAYPGLARSPGRTPEETLEYDMVNRLRFSEQHRTLFLPFSGGWTVWQGFDGKWTHQGNWRYAYDFVITDGDSKTYCGDGTRLEDYFCYRKPVLAPVSGRVAKVISNLPDHAIGQPDESDNWGNLVILQDPRGHFIELSHFAADSIRVQEGDRGEHGAMLGLCGNSGYSPQPHIHVQVQATDHVGDATLPFRFVSYTRNNEYQTNGLPLENERVEPAWPDKRIDALTTFNLDDVLHYEVLCHGKLTDRLDLTVRMAPDGTFYFESRLGKLYFGKRASTFYFYRLDGQDPWLRLLFLALPRLPMVHEDRLRWHDFVPLGVATSGVRRVMARLASAFYPELARVRVEQAFHGRNVVESQIRSAALALNVTARVELDADNGFGSIQVGRFELREARKECQSPRFHSLPEISPNSSTDRKRRALWRIVRA